MYFFSFTLVLDYNRGIQAYEKRFITYLREMYCTDPLQKKTFSPSSYSNKLRNSNNGNNTHL